MAQRVVHDRAEQGRPAVAQVDGDPVQVEVLVWRAQRAGADHHDAIGPELEGRSERLATAGGAVDVPPAASAGSSTRTEGNRAGIAAEAIRWET